MKVVTLLVCLGILLAGCSARPTATKTDGPTSISAEAHVSNAFAGMDKQVGMPLHNGESDAITFTFEYLTITDLRAGYELPPEQTGDWLTLPSELIVQPGETVAVPVRFKIPKDAGDLPTKWEFGIRASDKNQKGFINQGIACTWLVSMR